MFQGRTVYTVASYAGLRPQSSKGIGGCEEPAKHSKRIALGNFMKFRLNFQLWPKLEHLPSQLPQVQDSPTYGHLRLRFPLGFGLRVFCMKMCRPDNFHSLHPFMVLSATAAPAEFVVFDVYNHARIRECQLDDSDERLVMIALQATPEIGTIFHWRRAQYILPGMPSRQVVLWGDWLPNSVILPVAFGPGLEAVCTVEAIQSYSALQIVLLACRACQLPSSLAQGVADAESSLWVNDRRLYPLDPHAGKGADTARLRGFGVSTFLDSRRIPSTQSTAVSSDTREARAFLQSLDDSLLGAHTHFTVFAEPTHVFVLPLPEGASMAELVYRAFGQFPGLGARCGHRILSRPLPGLPPIQICIWDNLAVDQRVLQIVLHDAAVTLTVRCPAVATPVQPAAAANHVGLNALTASLAERTYHLTGDGLPL